MTDGFLTYYHDELEPPHNTCQVPDTHDGRIAAEAMVRESGGHWKLAPEPDDETPGVAPEPVEYAPVKKATASRAKASDKDKGE